MWSWSTDAGRAGIQPALTSPSSLHMYSSPVNVHRLVWICPVHVAVLSSLCFMFNNPLSHPNSLVASHHAYMAIYYDMDIIPIWLVITSPPHRGRARYSNAHVCLFVCLCVCVFVCPCFRKISKCNISAISQPIIMKLGIHITYGYTVTDKYFQNFRSKVKVVGRRKVKNVIWPYLGNEWS